MSERDLHWQYRYLMWLYLNHMVIPGNSVTNFQPSFEASFPPPPNEATYQQLMTMIRHTIDPYLTVNNEDNQTITEEANRTAREIHQDLSDLGFSGEIHPSRWNYFKSSPYSNLPILLANALGLLPIIVVTRGLYPNEWKALLDADIHLCEDVEGHSYFYWLIDNYNRGRSLDLRRTETSEENLLPYLPGYTAEASSYFGESYALFEMR